MSAKRSDGLSEFAGWWRHEIRRTWDELPEDTRRELSYAVGVLPKELKGWRALISQAVEHVRVATGDKQAVAILGPVNTGKSTLYNQLIRARSDQAAVSAVPGTTRQAQEADAGIFSVVDTPGADAAGAVGEAEKAEALQAAEHSDLIVLLFDAGHGIGQAERRLFDQLSALKIPMVVGLNKMDLVGGERAAVIGRAASALGLSSEQIIPMSARSGVGVERLLLAIAKSEPRIVAALGKALPEYRWKLAQAVIARAATTAAAVALTPLPFLDFFPLVGVQSAMVLSIARIHAYKITLARARELLATFGMGLLGRTLFYELGKLGGPPGWLVGAAVAAGTTVTMGYAATAWFSRGDRLPQETLQQISRTVGKTMVDRLRSMGRRRTKKAALREQLSQALDELPAPHQLGEVTPEESRKAKDSRGAERP